MQTTLNFKHLLSHAQTAANSEHEMRSTLAMYKKPDIPELLAIDHLARILEEQSRAFIQHCLTPTSLLQPDIGKPLLRAIYRISSFSHRTLRLTQKDLGYTLLPEPALTTLTQLTQLQQEIVKSMDNELNKAFESFLESDASPSLPNDPEIELITQYNKEPIEELSSPFDQHELNQIYNELNYRKIDLLNKLILKPIEKDQKPALNWNNLVSSTKHVCNTAHSIQNVIYSNKLLDKIGKEQPLDALLKPSRSIEDQCRTILQALVNQRNKPPQVKKVITAQVNAIQGQLEKLQEGFKKVQSLNYNSNAIEEISRITNQIKKSLTFFTDDVLNGKLPEILLA